MEEEEKRIGIKLGKMKEEKIQKRIEQQQRLLMMHIMMMCQRRLEGFFREPNEDH